MVGAEGAGLGRVDVIGQNGAEACTVQAQSQARQAAAREELAGRQVSVGGGANRHEDTLTQASRFGACLDGVKAKPDFGRKPSERTAMRVALFSAAAVSLAVSLALAASSPPAEKAAEPAKAEPRALAGVDLDQPLRVLGTEPFWAVESTPPGLTYSGGDLPGQEAAN